MLFIHLNAEYQLCFGHLPIRCYRCRCCVSQTRSSKLLQNNNSSVSKVWVYDYNLLKATFIILNHILYATLMNSMIRFKFNLFDCIQLTGGVSNTKNGLSLTTRQISLNSYIHYQRFELMLSTSKSTIHWIISHLSESHFIAH
jgi:hypothetical protein